MPYIALNLESLLRERAELEKEIESWEYILQNADLARARLPLAKSALDKTDQAITECRKSLRDQTE